MGKEYIKKAGSRVGVSMREFLVRGSDGKPIGTGGIVSAAKHGEPSKE